MLVTSSKSENSVDLPPLLNKLTIKIIVWSDCGTICLLAKGYVMDKLLRLGERIIFKLVVLASSLGAKKGTTQRVFTEIRPYRDLSLTSATVIFTKIVKIHLVLHSLTMHYLLGTSRKSTMYLLSCDFGVLTYTRVRTDWPSNLQSN